MSDQTHPIIQSPDHPLVAEQCELLHKIDYTREELVDRIANSRGERTFLMAGVESVAT